ncbi:MAG: VCBS repeat-containing protein, partial [Bacteroidota bacterium]
DTLARLPGSNRSFSMDTDGDGRREIIVMMSQAREGIYRIGSAGPEPILTFPPQFGLSDVDTADINLDGHTDLIVVNGDNADYSNIAKAYHGVRIYLNDGSGQFDESYFYPIYGATKVQSIDVEADGNFEFVVAAYFPQGDAKSAILLFRKAGDTPQLSYNISKFNSADRGRWMTMEKGDVDQDGDTDLILGSFTMGPTPMPGTIVKDWNDASVDVLILRNRGQLPTRVNDRTARLNR